MITKVRNTVFTNNRNVGAYVDTAFITVVQEKKGEEQQLRVRARTHYFDEGSGQALLLLHGNLQSAYLYKNNIMELTEQYRVLVPDLLGHGYSDAPDMDYTVEDYSLFIEAFLRALHVERVSIVAYGQSAAYALDFAFYNPGVVDRLVVMNPGAFARTHFGGARMMGGALGGLVQNRYASRNYMKKCLNKGFFDQTLLSDRDLIEFCRPLEDAGISFCNRMAVRNFNDTEVLARISRLNKKVLFIEGEDDTLTNHNDTQAYFQTLREVYLLKIRNCGMLPAFEKPEYVNKGILEFLSVD